MQPYDVRIVPLLSDHRFLATESFRDEFPREIIQRTRQILGDLVRIDAAAAHPLAEAIRRDGLDAAIVNYDDVSPRRTWAFVVRVEGGQFYLQGRFFDGLTGLPGPKSQTVMTNDRSRLAQLAARMIADPFPLVGAVTGVKGDSVELTLYGGLLADKGTPRGTVFAISRIGSESGKLKARPVPWAVLEAKTPAAAGRVSCQLWRRFREDNLATSDRVVYRALMLPTISAPLKLQVIDQETLQPLAGIGVHITGGVPRALDLSTDAAGQIVTPEKVAGLALVKLSQGNAMIAQFPIPMIDDRPIISAVSVRPEAEDFASLEIRRQQLIVRVLGTLQVVDQRFGDLRELLGQSPEKALSHSRQTLAFLDREIDDIKQERAEISQLASKLTTTKVRPEESEKGLTRLIQLRTAVDESIQRTVRSIAERERQTERQKEVVRFIEQAAILEHQSQFDEAIAHFEKAVALLPEPGKIGQHLEKLRTDWAIKNDSHREARKYLIETWPKVDVSNLKDELNNAQKALDVCRESDDRLTPRRFLAANVDHRANIAKTLEKLKRSRAPDDRAKLITWHETLETMRRLSNDAIERTSKIDDASKKK